MAFETIITKNEEHVGIIILNRPKALNAINPQLLKELGQALTSMDADEKIRAIVLTGSDKAFAAGADIKEMVDKTFVDMYSKNFLSDEFSIIATIRKPIIAAVSGFALGGGCELAMACDFILCSETAKFGQPEINLGVMAGLGGTQRLTRLVGKSKAMEMNLTGRFMDAEEAERAGLVSRIVPATKLLEEAVSTAAKIGEKSRISTLAIKESVNRAYESTLSEGLLFEQRLFDALFSTKDQTEGMTAFIEKRSPKFRDK